MPPSTWEPLFHVWDMAMHGRQLLNCYPIRTFSLHAHSRFAPHPPLENVYSQLSYPYTICYAILDVGRYYNQMGGSFYLLCHWILSRIKLYCTTQRCLGIAWNWHGCRSGIIIRQSYFHFKNNQSWIDVQQQSTSTRFRKRLRCGTRGTFRIDTHCWHTMSKYDHLTHKCIVLDQIRGHILSNMEVTELRSCLQ